jgi:hypothetical protein
VLDALEDAGVAVDEAALSQPTLDDAFFALADAPQRERSGGEASGRDRTVAA